MLLANYTLLILMHKNTETINLQFKSIEGKSSRAKTNQRLKFSLNLKA